MVTATQLRLRSTIMQVQPRRPHRHLHDRFLRSMQARLRGDRIETARLILSLGTLAALDQGQEPECASGKARGGRGLGRLNKRRPARTHL